MSLHNGSNEGHQREMKQREMLLLADEIKVWYQDALTDYDNETVAKAALLAAVSYLRDIGMASLAQYLGRALERLASGEAGDEALL